MHVDQRLAPVELFVDRGEGRIAEILRAVAREQPNPVRLQRIEGAFDFLEAAVDVGR
jgi:hypothetical protein